MSNITHNSLATKDNSLIPLLKDYNIDELRLIYFCIAHYDSRSKDNLRREAHVKDLTKIYPALSLDNAYSTIDRAIVSVNSKPMRFKEGKKKKLRFWFTGLDYTEGEGLFEFRLSPDIEPYLLDLKKGMGGFTSIRLADIYQFSSSTTWLFYELLRQYLRARKKMYTLEELKESLGISLESYPRWQDFKKKIVAPHLKIISEKSDIDVSYTYVKKRNKIIGLNFSIYPADGYEGETIDQQSSSEQLYDRLLSVGITEDKAQKLMSLIEQKERLFTITSKFEKKNKASKTKKKPTGWMIDWVERECKQGRIEDEEASTHLITEKMTDEELLILARAGNSACKKEAEQRGLKIETF